MRDDERAAIRFLGGFVGLMGVAIGVYVLAISHVSHLASSALAALTVSVLLFIAAHDPEDDAPSAEDLE